MGMIRRFVGASVLLPVVCLAQQEPPSGLPPAVGPQVQVSPPTKPDDKLPDMGPNVVISPRPGQPMIQEYRVNDRIFMIKVTPLKGFSYYLMDTDGDGRLDTRRNALEPDLLVPAWPLLRWK